MYSSRYFYFTTKSVFKDFLHIIKVTVIDIYLALAHCCTLHPAPSLHPTPYSLQVLGSLNYLALRFITFKENNETYFDEPELIIVINSFILFSSRLGNNAGRLL